MSLDTALWFFASLAEAAVIGLLLYRRVWRTLPMFFVYSVWTLVGSMGAYAIIRAFPSGYVTAYIAEMIVDSVLLFGVLVELAWSVLLPLRSSLPRAGFFVVGCLILVIGAAIWPFAGISGTALPSPEVGALTHLQQTFSILRILVFLVLAGCSQLLSIGWRNRELQIATGLGFNSLVGLAVAVLHTHGTTWVQYRNMNRFVVASYLCSLVYWVISFAQKEEERRAVTPQMQSLLRAMAGSAKAARVALADPGSARTGKLGPL